MDRGQRKEKSGTLGERQANREGGAQLSGSIGTKPVDKVQGQGNGRSLNTGAGALNLGGHGGAEGAKFPSVSLFLPLSKLHSVQARPKLAR